MTLKNIICYEMKMITFSPLGGMNTQEDKGESGQEQLGKPRSRKHGTRESERLSCSWVLYGKNTEDLNCHAKKSVLESLANLKLVKSFN